MICDGFENKTVVPATDEARLHVLFLCVVRSIVEKHGGSMETDPETYNAQISVPTNVKDVCFDELETLFTCEKLAFCDQKSW